MRERLLFSANLSIFQIHRLYHGENKLILYEMMTRTDLYQTYTLTWFCIVLAHWNNIAWIEMSPTPTHYPYFELTSFCYFSVMISGEATTYQFRSFWFHPIEADPTIYHIRGEHANHYTTDVVPLNIYIGRWIYTSNRQVIRCYAISVGELKSSRFRECSCDIWIS